MNADFDDRRITLGTRRGVKVMQYGECVIVDGSAQLFTDPRLLFGASDDEQPLPIPKRWVSPVKPARPGFLWCSSPFHNLPGDDGWRPVNQFADAPERKSGKRPWCRACERRYTRDAYTERKRRLLRQYQHAGAG